LQIVPGPEDRITQTGRAAAGKIANQKGKRSCVYPQPAKVAKRD
jgi:hypothetical protein